MKQTSQVAYLSDSSDHHTGWLFTVRIRHRERVAEITEYLSADNANFMQSRSKQT